MVTAIEYVNTTKSMNRSEIRSLAASAVEACWLSGEDYRYILDCLEDGGGIELIAAFHTLRVAAWKANQEARRG